MGKVPNICIYFSHVLLLITINKNFSWHFTSVREKILSIMTLELLLRQRVTELMAENTKLKQIIEENARHDSENT
jgi:hypothetical protein